MPIPLGSDLRKTCREGSDSSCEQWKLTDGRQPCTDADMEKCDDRRVKNGCRGKRERRGPEVREAETTNIDENINGGVTLG